MSHAQKDRTVADLDTYEYRYMTYCTVGARAYSKWSSYAPSLRGEYVKAEVTLIMVGKGRTSSLQKEIIKPFILLDLRNEQCRVSVYIRLFRAQTVVDLRMNVEASAPASQASSGCHSMFHHRRNSSLQIVLLIMAQVLLYIS